MNQLRTLKGDLEGITRSLERQEPLCETLPARMLHSGLVKDLQAAAEKLEALEREVWRTEPGPEPVSETP